MAKEFSTQVKSSLLSDKFPFPYNPQSTASVPCDTRLHYLRMLHYAASSTNTAETRTSIIQTLNLCEQGCKEFRRKPHNNEDMKMAV